MLHGMVYEGDQRFYDENLHNPRKALGAFCSGGTTANITALWVARNQMFPPTESFAGLASDGLAAAMSSKGYKRLVILVSERGHYSLGKSADVLGIGRSNVISIPTDERSKIDIEQLKQTCEQLAADNVGILSIVGIAGATETGQVDPLDQMANIAKQYNAHFHVMRINNFMCQWAQAWWYLKTHHA